MFEGHGLGGRCEGEHEECGRQAETHTSIFSCRERPERIAAMGRPARAFDTIGSGMKLLAMMVWAMPLAAASAEWAGSAACARCHSEIYRSYLQTPMAVSAGTPGNGTPETFDRASFTHSASGFRYRVRREGKRYLLEFERTGGEMPVRGKVPLDFFVGSGSIARSYVWSAGGFLFEAPVAYYAAERAWNLQPGYDQYSYPFLTRPIAAGCLECHASRVQPLEGTLNGFASPPFLENGVACERCHGPGAGHAAGRGPIVNPAKLDAGRRDSVCDQCHLSGEQRVVRAGRERLPFVAGERLRDYVTVFVRGDAAAGMKVTSHAENLEQSACRRASGARLWCGSCHDPHKVPRNPERAGWFRSKCEACHQPGDCRETAAARREKDDDCTACHMPKNSVADAEHVVYTDHSIPRRPRALVAAAPPSELVPFGGGEAGPRDTGMAYAMLADRTGSETARKRSFDLLRGRQAQLENDPRALLYLGDHYRRLDEDARAIPLYERAKELDPAQATAASVLGAIRMEQGQFAVAAALWREALSRNPGLVLVRFNLAGALIRMGDFQDAQRQLERTLEFNPSFAAAARLLDEIRQRR